MSATSVRLEWTVVINDCEKFPPELRERLHTEDPTELTPGTCDDWVAAQIAAAMEKAGNEYIRANPDLFRLQELV